MIKTWAKATPFSSHPFPNTVPGTGVEVQVHLSKICATLASLEGELLARKHDMHGPKRGHGSGILIKEGALALSGSGRGPVNNGGSASACMPDSSRGEEGRRIGCFC